VPSAIRSDLTNCREQVLDALARGPKRSQLPKTAAKTIERIITDYQKRVKRARTAPQKQLAKERLEEIAKVISRASDLIGNMKDEEKNWICRKLGKDLEVSSPRGSHKTLVRLARKKGDDILISYLTSSNDVIKAAKLALTPVSRPLNKKSAEARLLRDLDKFWKKIHHESPLNSGLNKDRRQYFEKSAIGIMDFGSGRTVSNSQFLRYVEEARKVPSDESDEDDHMMC
jgi:hypothetical protein